MISIIMPVRNAVPFLSICLDSILQQTFLNWELLAVNDLSDDGSNEILAQYSEKDNRIKCLQNNGEGIIAALQTGYAHSKGKFITRMDADDIMPSIKLEQLINLLQDSGRQHLSTGKIKYISENELGNGFKKYEEWLNRLCNDNTHYQDIYRECVIPSPCWMMYREDFESIGGFEGETYPEDYDLCFRMYENQIKVTSSSEILHIWRDHGNRASRNDNNYSDNRFLDLKVKYFLRNEYEANDSLIVWGAGKKGKQIAQLLIAKNIDFEWITNNDKKIGKHIYEKKLLNQTLISSGNSKKILVAVANDEDQKEILTLVHSADNSHKLYKFC